MAHKITVNQTGAFYFSQACSEDVFNFFQKQTNVSFHFISELGACKQLETLKDFAACQGPQSSVSDIGSGHPFLRARPGGAWSVFCSRALVPLVSSLSRCP